LLITIRPIASPVGTCRCSRRARKAILCAIALRLLSARGAVAEVAAVDLAALDETDHGGHRLLPEQCDACVEDEQQS